MLELVLGESKELGSALPLLPLAPVAHKAQGEEELTLVPALRLELEQAPAGNRALGLELALARAWPLVRALALELEHGQQVERSLANAEQCHEPKPRQLALTEPVSLQRAPLSLSEESEVDPSRDHVRDHDHGPHRQSQL